MMDPPVPWATITLPPAAASKAGARRLIAIVSSNLSGSVSMAGSGWEIPAFLTRMSNPPNASAACWARLSGAPYPARSIAAVAICAPNSSARADSAERRSATSRPLRMSFAPAAAKVRAMSAPMPLVAPVISARLPSRRRPAAEGNSACDIGQTRAVENGGGGPGIGDELVEIAPGRAADDRVDLVPAHRHGDGDRDVAQRLELDGDQSVAAFEVDWLARPIVEPRADVAYRGPQRIRADRNESRDVRPHQRRRPHSHERAAGMRPQMQHALNGGVVEQRRVQVRSG